MGILLNLSARPRESGDPDLALADNRLDSRFRGNERWRCLRGVTLCAADSVCSLSTDSVCSLPRLRGRVGEGVSLHESCCVPPPCPSPAGGGGDAVAQALASFNSADGYSTTLMRVDTVRQTR